MDNLPEKWIRKAVSEAVGAFYIGDYLVKIFDTRVPAIELENDAFVIMSTQLTSESDNSKCGHIWESSLLLDITTIYRKPGNPGSRLLVDDITQEVKDSLDGLQLAVASGMSIINIDLEYPPGIFSSTKSENAFRKFIRITLKIN